MMNPGNASNDRILPAERRRGGYLTAFLIAGLVICAVGAVYLVLISIFGYEALQQAIPAVSREYWIWAAFLAMANFIAFLGIWWWRRWGVYTFISTSLIGFLVDISLPFGGGTLSFIRSLILIGLLVLLLRNKWALME